MRMAKKVTTILFLISVVITLLDLTSVPRCPCVDPWNVYSLIAWFLTLGVAALAARSFSKGSRERRMLFIIIVIALFSILFALVGIYSGYHSKISFEEKMQNLEIIDMTF